MGLSKKKFFIIYPNIATLTKIKEQLYNILCINFKKKNWENGFCFYKKEANSRKNFQHFYSFFISRPREVHYMFLFNFIAFSINHNLHRRGNYPLSVFFLILSFINYFTLFCFSRVNFLFGTFSEKIWVICWHHQTLLPWNRGLLERNFVKYFEFFQTFSESLK